MTQRPPLRVAVVGGGVSGLLVCLHLHRYATAPIQVDLFESSAVIAGGPAYAWRNPVHLLNGEADHLSVYDEEPDDFVDWLGQAPQAAPFLSPDLPVDRQFVPRFLFSDYIRERFERVCSEPRRCVLRLHAQSTVDGILPRELDVRLRVGTRLHDAEHVILASGNPLPRPLFAALVGVKCVENPWQPDWVRAVPPGPVLMVGTGQTMVDTALALQASGHAGTMHAVSRHGLVPAAHRYALPTYAIDPARFPRRLRDALRFVRSELQAAERAGVDWRAVLNALRPLAGEAWPGLSTAEKRQFYRHLATLWWSHRQRLAPAVGAKLDALLESRRLLVHRGRIARMQTQARTAVVTVATGQHEQTLTANTLVNCTGPDFDYSACPMRAVRDLLASGAAQPHGTGSGLDVDSELAMVGADGRVSSRIRAIGAATRGAFLEALAIRDLRRQSRTLVRALLRDYVAAQACPESANLQTQL